MTQKHKEISPCLESQSIEQALRAVGHIPVASLRHKIRPELEEHPNFVLVGETGSGKTTCTGPLLVELRNKLKLEGRVGITQPRKIATTSVTTRVSDMLGTEVGDRVGYHIRFEDVTSENTDITFMTDGILLRKIQYDPYLLEFAIIMVDEAHERSLNIDLCLGLLKEVNIRRSDVGIEPIRIIISSATIERNRFASYIGYGDQDNSVEIKGKMYPVEVLYEKDTPPDYDYIGASANKVRDIVTRKSPGDILIFMPGKREIGLVIEKIMALPGSDNLDVMPLHAELSPDDQNRIFLPSDQRKVIVSTNIAETSVTIDGIIHVIDSGLVKQTQFDPKSGIEQLCLVKHALSGLEQRKGRAGRTAPGFCYRLFTKDSLRNRLDYQVPEIQRSSLAQVVLTMKKVGIQDIEEFDFLDKPGAEAIHQAEDLLFLLGALDDYGQLTEIGEFMVDLSLEPRLGRMVVEAARQKSNCINEICIIASFLDGKNIFVHPSDPIQAKEADRYHRQFETDNDSDFTVILNVWQAYVKSGYDSDWAKKNYLNEKALEEAKNVRLELIEVLASHKIYVDANTKPRINRDAIGKAITAGLVGNLMRYTGKNFKKIDGTKSDIHIHPGSVYFNVGFPDGSYVVCDEIFMNQEGKAYASNCLLVKQEWIMEVAPQLRRLTQNTKGNNKGHRSKGKGKGRHRNVYDSHSRQNGRR